MNELKGQRQDKCDNCGNWLKPNYRKNCPARYIFCNNCSGRGPVAKQCKMPLGNLVDGFEFMQYETNVIQKWDDETDDEEFGV